MVKPFRRVFKVKVKVTSCRISTFPWRGRQLSLFNIIIYWRLIAQSTRTGSPQGFSQVQMPHKLNTMQNIQITIYIYIYMPLQKHTRTASTLREEDKKQVGQAFHSFKHFKVKVMEMSMRMYAAGRTSCRRSHTQTVSPLGEDKKTSRSSLSNGFSSHGHGQGPGNELEDVCHAWLTCAVWMSQFKYCFPLPIHCDPVCLYTKVIKMSMSMMPCISLLPSQLWMP